MQQKMHNLHLASTVCRSIPDGPPALTPPPPMLKGLCSLKDITLVWESPQGDLDSFEVQYLDAQGRLIQNFTYTNSISIGGLRPYRHQFHIPTHLNMISVLEVKCSRNSLCSKIECFCNITNIS